MCAIKNNSSVHQEHSAPAPTVCTSGLYSHAVHTALLSADNVCNTKHIPHSQYCQQPSHRKSGCTKGQLLCPLLIHHSSASKTHQTNIAVKGLPHLNTCMNDLVRAAFNAVLTCNKQTVWTYSLEQVQKTWQSFTCLICMHISITACVQLHQHQNVT